MIVIRETKDLAKLEGWMIADVKVDVGTGSLHLRMTHILEEAIVVELSPISLVTPSGNGLMINSTITVRARGVANVGDAGDS